MNKLNDFDLDEAVLRSGPEARYFAWLAAGVFALQTCEACYEAVFYPRALCPFCGNDCLAWFAASGHGTVYATTYLHDKNGHAYNVSLIDLREGPRLMSRVEGLRPEEVAIGLNVKARILPGSPSPLLVFEPREVDA